MSVTKTTFLGDKVNERLNQFLRFLEAEKPEFLPPQLDVMGLVRRLAITNPITAAQELPQKLAQSRQMLEEYTPGQQIDPRLLDQFMSLTGFAPAGMTKIVREGNPIQSAVVLIGDKIFTGQTHGQALNRAVYEGVVKKEGGRYIYPKDVEINSDLFMTKDGRIIDRLDAYKEFNIGGAETAVERGLMQTKPASSMTVDEYITEANKLKSLLD